MAKYVAHLDADCFYVSAERVRMPQLIGKPVGVLGNQGACVIAKSYEMKDRGIKTGEPIWDAVQKCPEGIYLKRDFRWYEVISRQMFDLVSANAPRVEYYSIDEFFFDVEMRHDRDDPSQLALDLRDLIKREVGVPTTIGIARTRTLAKLFSDTAKPFGAVAVLDRQEERERLARIPVTEISGIARRRAARIEPYGIKTCLQLADADGKLIKRLLTKTGYELWLELNGERVGTVRPERIPHQTISRGGSLGGMVRDEAILWAWAVRNLERLIEELEFHQVRVVQFVVYLWYKNAPAGESVINLDVPTARFDLLLDSLRHAIAQAWRPGETATHMHLIANRLQRGSSIQHSLFDPPSPKWDKVAEAKRQINERLGRFAVRSAATLPLYSIYHDNSNAYDICDIRGKFCF